MRDYARPFLGWVAVALSVILAACTAAVEPTATPAPTEYLRTPEAGGSSYSRTETQHQEMLQRDALVAAAEQVYRRVFDMEQHLYAAGIEADDSVLENLAGGVGYCIEACLDSSQTIRIRSDGERYQGVVGVERAYFVRHGASLKVALFESTLVPTC